MNETIVPDPQSVAESMAERYRQEELRQQQESAVRQFVDITSAKSMADFNKYLSSRPYKDSQDQAHEPVTNRLIAPDDVYFEEKRQQHFANSGQEASQDWDNMSAIELARICGRAEANGDNRKVGFINDLLVDRVMAMKTEKYPDGLPDTSKDIIINRLIKIKDEALENAMLEAQQRLDSERADAPEVSNEDDNSSTETEGPEVVDDLSPNQKLSAAITRAQAAGPDNEQLRKELNAALMEVADQEGWSDDERAQRGRIIQTIAYGENQSPNNDVPPTAANQSQEIVPHVTSTAIEVYDNGGEIDRGWKARFKSAASRARNALSSFYMAAKVKAGNSLVGSKEYFRDEEQGGRRRRRIIAGVVGVAAVAAVMAGALSEADKGWLDLAPSFIDGDGVAIDLPGNGESAGRQGAADSKVTIAGPEIPAEGLNPAAETVTDWVVHSDGITDTVRDVIKTNSGLKATPEELKQLYLEYKPRLIELPGVVEMDVWGGYGFSAPGITTELPVELVEDLVNGLKSKRGL